MKKFILLLVFSYSVTFFVSAQSDSFCEIYMRGYRAKIDFGQECTYRDRIILDNNGEYRKFNSLIDALNFLTKNGWEFVQAYSEDDGDSTYILKWDGSKGEPFIPKTKGSRSRANGD